MQEVWERKVIEEIAGILDRNGIRESENGFAISKRVAQIAISGLEGNIKKLNEDYRELYINACVNYQKLLGEYMGVGDYREKEGYKKILKDMYELLQVAEADEVSICCEDIENIAERYGIKKEELR